MKKLIPILFIILLLTSCEQKTHYYCYQCNSVVYGKLINDIFCHEDITEVENYKARLMDFYKGSMTTIECELLPE